MAIQIPVIYRGIDFILHVEEYNYHAPYYGSRYDPPEDEFLEPTDCWIEIDGNNTPVVEMINNQLSESSVMLDAVMERNELLISEEVINYEKERIACLEYDKREYNMEQC